MSTMFILNLGIYIGLLVIGIAIGRLKKQDAYEKKIKQLEEDKEHYRQITLRQRDRLGDKFET